MRRALVLAGLLLIGIGLALYFSFSRTEVARALGQGQPVHILWTFRLSPPRPPELAVSVSLLPRGEIFFLLIPGSLSVPRESGWSTLSSVYREEGRACWEETIAGILGWSFLSAQEFDPSSFAALVEAAGGVVVRPSTRLFQHDPEVGLHIDFPPGEQLLFGEAAREFLIYAFQYEEDPKFSLGHEFFADFLARLWARGKTALSALGKKTWEIQDFWRRALSLPREAVRLETLPVVQKDSHLLPDFVRIRKLWVRVTRGRAPLTRDEVGVMVLNGTRERFLATRTADWLSGCGFRIIGVGSADRSDYAKTVLVVGAGAEEKAELLRPLLPKSTEVISASAFGMDKLGGWPAGADLVLILGSDLRT